MAELINKTEYEEALAQIAAIERTDLPTVIVAGREKPVNEINYKRNMGKQITRAHLEKLAALAVAPMIAAGYPDAVCRVQSGKLVIYLHGRNREDI